MKRYGEVDTGPAIEGSVKWERVVLFNLPRHLKIRYAIACMRKWSDFCWRHSNHMHFWGVPPGYQAGNYNVVPPFEKMEDLDFAAVCWLAQRGISA